MGRGDWLAISLLAAVPVCSVIVLIDARAEISTVWWRDYYSYECYLLQNYWSVCATLAVLYASVATFVQVLCGKLLEGIITGLFYGITIGGAFEGMQYVYNRLSACCVQNDDTPMPV